MCAFVCLHSGLGRNFRTGAMSSTPVLTPFVGFNKSIARGATGPRRRRPSNSVLTGRFVSTVRGLSHIGTPASSGIADPVAAQEVQDSKEKIVENPYHGKKAVVIGAGPGGSMAAIVLARRGFDVKVFEKRQDPTLVAMTVQRSVSILLNPEVTQVLLDMGIEVPLGKFSNGITAFKHSTIIEGSGEPTKYIPRVQSGTRALTERHCFTNAVLQAAISQKLPNLEFVFESACEDVDMDGKVVRFSSLEGGIEEVPYDLLIAADGVNSRVRGALQSSGHLEFEQRKCTWKYISVRDTPIPDELSECLTGALEVGVPSYITPKRSIVEETPTNILYYRTENNRVQMAVFGTAKGFENLKGREREWAESTLPSHFPREWLDRVAEAIQEKSLSTIGPVTYCSSYIGPDIALIGDACHSATPTLGIGANQAILDVKALDNALGESNGNLEDALQVYDQETRPKVAAIQELEVKHSLSYLEDRNPLWVAFHWVYFHFHMTGSKWLPKLISPPVHYLMVGSVITPQVALERFTREGSIFFGLVCAAACAALALGLNAYSGLA